MYELIRDGEGIATAKCSIAAAKSMYEGDRITEEVLRRSKINTNCV